MKRLRGLILIFCVALSAPLAYFILRTYISLEQEETARLRYFADTLFYEMEQGLAELVRTEESRPVDVYNYYYHPESGGDTETPVRSPLSKRPESAFIVGYFQNNRDGSFQTPLVKKGEPPSAVVAGLVDELREINREFNSKRIAAPAGYKAPVADPSKAVIKQKEETAFADRYLKLDRRREVKSTLGFEKKRVEKITPSQAQNIAQLDQQQAERDDAPMMENEQSAWRRSDADENRSLDSAEDVMSEPAAPAPALSARLKDEAPPAVAPVIRDRLEVEVDPLQSVLINDRRIFMFRRILFRNDVYRQGFVLDTRAFLSFLSDTYFSGQPMAQYAGLHLKVTDGGRAVAARQSGGTGTESIFTIERPFPRPFSFLQATLICHRIPASEGRRTLTIMISVLAGIILIGLFAIYRSARVVMDLSERRSKFVSSVTHELKTPLTNIRMYIEMLEQGIAATPEREQHYFQVLNSESARLSRLINNVLEFSRIEKKQYNFDMRNGDFDDVIQEVRHVLNEKLRQDGFQLIVEKEDDFSFSYDREVMIQLLINLIENSIKFGAAADRKEIRTGIRREKKWIIVSVSDYGPGIPKHALKRVFDDFYRVESEGGQAVRGAGIGLAFVKKLVAAMGGKVKAENNDGPGCTIGIWLKRAENGGE